MKNVSAEDHGKKYRGGNFKHFKISIQRSRNKMVGHCITSSNKDVKW